MHVLAIVLNSRVFTGLLIGYNTLRRHLYIMEQRRKLQPMFCASVKPWLHSDTSLGSIFLDPEVVRSLSLGAVWNFSKGTGLP
jgi:hypothetical protein